MSLEVENLHENFAEIDVPENESDEVYWSPNKEEKNTKFLSPHEVFWSPSVEEISNVNDLHKHLEEEHAMIECAKRTKHIMFGGIDGVITTFSIIAAGVGAELDHKNIMLMACANLFADAFSMGFGDFISSISERNYILVESAKEKLEFENNPREEIAELAGFFVEKGMAPTDALDICRTIGKHDVQNQPLYPELFGQIMILMELHLNEPPALEEILFESLSTFFSFMIFGVIPPGLYFLIAQFTELNQMQNFFLCAIIAAVTLFCIGVICALSTKQEPISHGFFTMINGIFACGIAFFIGYLMHEDGTR